MWCVLEDHGLVILSLTTGTLLVVLQVVLQTAGARWKKIVNFGTCFSPD